MRLTECSRVLRLVVAVPVLALAVGSPPAVAQARCTRPVMVVLDSSGSMNARARLLTRMQAAEQALARLLPSVSALRPVGLVVYAGTFSRCDEVRLAVPPALGSSAAILAAIAGAQPAGATPLGAAVGLAADYFHDRGEPGTLVVVTDGEESCGADICALAAKLGARHPPVDIHVVGYDLEEAQSGMRCFADQTGGQYTTVRHEDDLLDALETAIQCPAISMYGEPQPPPG